MATFIGKVQGTRGEVHRLGHRRIESETNGWTLGVKVIGLRHDDGSVTFEVFRTGGTNGNERELKIAEVRA